MSTKEVYRLTGGRWVSSNGGIIVPPFINPTGRISRVRSVATGTVAPPSNPNYSTWTPGTVQPNYAPTDGGVSNIACRLPSSQLQQINTAIYTPPAGSTMQGIELFGELLLPAGAPVTIRDCILHGPNRATYDSGIVRGASRDLRGALLEWCTLDNTGRESSWTDGIKGGNFTARYCVITRSNDGLGWSAPVGNGVFENSRIVNGYYTGWYNSATGAAYAGYPSSPSDMKSHSDGVQIQGRSGWELRGNFIGGQPASGWTTSGQPLNRDPGIPAQLAYQQLIDSGLDYANSGVLVQNNIGSTAPVGAMIENNWFAGGAAFINLNGTLNGDTLTGATVRNNRIIRDKRGSSYGGFKIYMSDNCNATVTGNVYDDTGALVTINLYNGGTRAQSS